MRRKRLFAVSCVAVIASGFGCGGSASPTGAPSGPSGIAATFVLPLLLTANVQASRGLLVEAVYAATAQTGAAAMGGVTKTGTLTVGPTGATYAASPADRLIVDMPPTRHEFVLQDVEGSVQAPDAATWMASPHLLKYRHAIKDEVEADVGVQYDGSNFIVTVKGWMKVGEGRFDLDLTARGAVTGEGNLSGQDRTTRATLTGTIRGAGFEADIHEDHVRRFVSAQGLDLLHAQRGWASQSETRSTSVIRSGGATYQFQNVDTRSDMTEKGGRVTNQTTSAGGVILCGGAPYGGISLEGGAALLKTASGAVALRL